MIRRKADLVAQFQALSAVFHISYIHVLLMAICSGVELSLLPFVQHALALEWQKPLNGSHLERQSSYHDPEGRSIVADFGAEPSPAVRGYALLLLAADEDLSRLIRMMKSVLEENR